MGARDKKQRKFVVELWNSYLNLRNQEDVQLLPLKRIDKATLENHVIKLHAKITVYRAVVLRSLLYSCET